MDTFETKLNVGQAGEILTEYYLRDVHKKVVTPLPGFNRTGDLLVSSKPVEVKIDITSAKSQNLAIEHRSLETHTADHIIYVLPRFYYIKREDLIWLSANPDFKQVNGGDDGRTQTLIPLNSEAFQKYFKKI